MCVSKEVLNALFDLGSTDDNIAIGILAHLDGQDKETEIYV